MKLWLGLYEPLMSHFRFPKFVSTQIDTILQLNLILRNFKRISSLTYNKTSPTFGVPVKRILNIISV